MSGTEQDRWAGGPDPTAIKDTDPRELTVPETRLGIALVVGLHTNHNTALNKGSLNSIYWYLTGDQLTRWKHIGTELSPDSGTMREEIAEEAGFYYDTITYGEDRNVKAFRRNQLHALLIALRESEDKRQHAQ
jgi:hypothetical protein